MPTSSSARRTGRRTADHLLDARVWPTLELVLTESSRVLSRVSDRESGLALLDVKAASGARAA
jgi:predicted DNA-binding protein with PD1-like motif